MIKLAVFASGSGSNALRFFETFSKSKTIKVQCLIVNKKTAGVLKKAETYQIPSYFIPKKELESPLILDVLKKESIDYIVLAGFLLKIPEHLINAFPDKIFNIHPSLLPKYGGKGMYGQYVHEAVKANNESESGMTIHLVNQEYDKGRILFQDSCLIHKEDTPSDIASNVLKLEHQHYVTVVESYIKKKIKEQ